MALTTAGKQSYSWRDAKGQVARTSFVVLFDGVAFADAESSAGGVRAALVALSNAALAGRNGFDAQVTVPSYGAVAVYEDVEDKASFTFIASDGTLHRLSVPAPKSTIFLADGQTVDTTNALVTALQTAFNVATGASGARVGTRALATFSATSLIGGIRLRRKTQR